MSHFLEIKGLKKLVEAEDGAGGHRKAKHTDYYTALWWSGWSLEQTQLFSHMAAPPVGQAAEVRPAFAFEDAALGKAEGKSSRE